MYTVGIGYDSSPVDVEDRTLDLPVDEQLRLAFGWGRELDKQSRWAITSEYVWLGDNKIDQTVQWERVKGDFDAYMIIVGVNYEHRF